MDLVNNTTNVRYTAQRIVLGVFQFTRFKHLYDDHRQRKSKYECMKRHKHKPLFFFFYKNLFYTFLRPFVM